MGRPRLNFTCVVEGCDLAAVARERCPRHHRQWCDEHPDEVMVQAPAGSTVPEVIALHSHRQGEHLIWTGHTTPEGLPRMGRPTGNPTGARYRSVNVRTALWHHEGRHVPHGHHIGVYPWCPWGCVEVSHLRLLATGRPNVVPVDTSWRDYELLAQLSAANGSLTAAGALRGISRQAVEQLRNRWLPGRGAALAEITRQAREIRAAAHPEETP